MKHLLLLPVLSVFILQGNNSFHYSEKSVGSIAGLSYTSTLNNATGLNLQPEPGTKKMSATEFKSRDFCYAELKDFEWDVHFSIVSATVYFTGANFSSVEFRTINGPSLKPLDNLRSRCVAGSIVTFDDVKVKGPDNFMRTIKGLTIMLH